MNAYTTIDLRALDAQQRGNPLEPDALPFDIQPDDPLAAAIRVHTDALRDASEGRGRA